MSRWQIKVNTRENDFSTNIAIKIPAVFNKFNACYFLILKKYYGNSHDVS